MEAGGRGLRLPGRFPTLRVLSRARPVRGMSHFSHRAGHNAVSRPRLPAGDGQRGGGLGRRGQTLVKTETLSATATQSLNGAPPTIRDSLFLTA